MGGHFRNYFVSVFLIAAAFFGGRSKFYLERYRTCQRKGTFSTEEARENDKSINPKAPESPPDQFPCTFAKNGRRGNSKLHLLMIRDFLNKSAHSKISKITYNSALHLNLYPKTNLFFRVKPSKIGVPKFHNLWRSGR